MMLQKSTPAKQSTKIVFLLIFLHLALTLPLAYVLNIWVDEASTLYTTQHGLIPTFQNVFDTEKQAPLYFLLLSLWRNIDLSVFFARLFSILWSCLAIKFFYDLAQKFFNRKQTILITAFFALHPFLIWISLEIRLYTLLVLLSCLLFNFFYEGFLEERKKSQILFILTAIVGLYTNYYLGFLLVGGFLCLLVLRRWKAAPIYFLQMFVVGISIIPLIWIIKMQLDINAGGYKEITHLIDGVKILWGHFLTFVFPTELLAPEEQTTISFVRVWLARVGVLSVILLLIKNKFRDLDERVLLFGTFSAVICGLLLFAFLLLGGEYIALRHAAVIFVPVILLVGSLLANLLPNKSWVILSIIFALLFPYSIYKLYPTFVKRGDWANIATFIKEREKPQQPIVIFQAYEAISLPYHYQGINKILPDERFFEWDVEDSLKSENALKKQIEFIISKIPPEAEGVWLITQDACQQPKTAIACRPLENFVEANYTVEIDEDFYFEKVRLLKKK